MKRTLILFLSGLFACQVSAFEASSSSDIFNLSLEELLKLQISTSAKSQQNLLDASNTISVITSEEIAHSAAQNLFELLATLPGISVDLEHRNVPDIDVRGLRRTPLLYLLNGQPLTGGISGDAKNTALIYLPLDNIERIEVVRGVGASLYGANALVGIVNIKTIQPQEKGKNQVTIKSQFEGSGRVNNTFNAYINKTINDNIKFNLNANVASHDGMERRVEADADGKSGIAENGIDAIDIQSSLIVDDYQFYLRYNDFDRDDFLGVTDYLSNQGYEEATQYFANINWQKTVSPNVQVNATAYYEHKKVDWFWVFFPASSGLTKKGQPFYPWRNDGLKSSTRWNESKLGSDFYINYQGVESHNLVLGMSAEQQKSFDIAHFANHNPDYLDNFQNVSTTFNWSQPKTRKEMALYLQDSWQLSDSVNMTYGARYDSYNDFGDTFNPRVSLIYDLNDKHKIKFIYGTAFRAPDFGDMYAINLFGTNGNPNIKPESLDSFELVWSGHLNTHLLIQGALFSNRITDLIVSGTTATNRGQSKAKGAEFDVNYQFNDALSINANYTFVDSTSNGHEFSNVAKHRGNFTTRYQVNDSAHFYLNGYFQSSSRNRAGINNPGYGVWHVKYSVYDLLPDLDFNITLNNLLDKKYRFPTLFAEPGFVAQGLSASVSFLYSF